MVRIIHATESKNVESILRLGVLPMWPKNSGHDWGKRVIYSWVPNDDNEKIARDYVYCKSWIHPRNAILERFWRNRSVDDYDWPDHYSFFKGVRIRDVRITILELCVGEDEVFEFCWHLQSNSMDKQHKLWGDFDTRYEHNTKLLAMLDHRIAPERIRVVGQAESIIKRCGKVDTVLRI